MPVRYDTIVAGQQLSLKAEDDEIIRIAANEVNRQVAQIKRKQPEAPAGTLPVLAALNLAEQNHFLNLQKKTDLDFCMNELNSMAFFLQNLMTELKKQKTVS